MLESVLNTADEQRAVIHLFLHVLVPLAVAFFCAPKMRWQTAFVVMLATMVVDIDHLLATPIYAPNRCSILFHPLHQLFPILVYVVMTLWPVGKRLMKQKLRPFESILGWVGLGLVIHMLLDATDCVWMKGGIDAVF